MAFENANEFPELVIGDAVGIRVTNGNLEIKTVEFDGVSGYSVTGDAMAIPSQNSADLAIINADGNPDLLFFRDGSLVSIKV